MGGKIIHIDGVDRTGKDTIKSALIKSSKGNYLVHVRSFISQLVYAKIYNRRIDTQFFIKNAVDASKRGEIFIVLKASTDELEKRFEKTNEQDLPVSDIDKHKKVFNIVIEQLRKKGVKIYEVNSDKDVKVILREIEAIILEREINKCKMCSLAKFGKNTLNIKNDKVKYLFVTRKANDAKELQQFLEKTEINDYQISSLIKCNAPYDVNDTQYSICADNLKNEIKFYKPKFVIVTGNDTYKQFKRNVKFPAQNLFKISSPFTVTIYNTKTEQEYINEIKNIIK